ncbi:RhsE core protein [Escherichia coli]|nr:RhsE core protein [Escherichia coli]
MWPDNRIARDAHYLYRYDRHGRLTEKTDLIPEGVIRTDDERTHRYHYDSRHRLVHYTRTQYAEPLVESRYLYDLLGRRVAKRVWRRERDLTGWMSLSRKPEVTWYGWDGDRLTTIQNDRTRIQTVYQPGSFTPLIRVETATGELAKTQRRSLADALQQSGGEDGGSVVFPPVLVQMLDRLESEILADRVSEESRRWLASCGLTVEQIQNQMDPVYTPARKIHLYHCDHRGLPLALVSTEGTTAWYAEYDEWGNQLNEENPHQLQQLIRLPGQQYDEESGLYYNRHRYYDPLQGRYITQDPIGLKGGWNFYQYPLNPISEIDPQGLNPLILSVVALNRLPDPELHPDSTLSMWPDNRIARDAHYLYRYDRHGRLTEKTDLIPEGVIRTDDERTHRYHYDSRHRLVHYTRTQYAEPLVESRYLYDPLGRRVAKRVWRRERDLTGWMSLSWKPEVTWYGWDGDRLTTIQNDRTRIQTVYQPGSFTPLIRVETATGELAKTQRRSLADALQQSGGEDGGSVVFPPVLVQMLDRLESEILADRVSEESRRWLASCGLTVEQIQNQMDPVYTPARKIHLYHCDHRGLPLALVSTEGTTAWYAEYDEWGNQLNEENPHQLQQLIRLPGQQYDEESGLYYNRHRYYDPLQGRYITQDPIGLKGGWNFYQYPLNPISNIDPLGLYEFKSKNIDDIGIFALAMCNGESINENKEYGGLICKKQGEYFPMNPISSNDNDSVDLRNIKCPEGSERVGDYHTHGFYSDDKGNKVTKENDVYDSLNFSSKDLTNSYMNGMGKKEYSSYLGTPNNTYLKYNLKAKGNGVTIIRQGSN